MSTGDTTAEEALAPQSEGLGLAAVLRPCLRSDRTMFGCLVVAAIWWTIVLGQLIVLRHNRFATFDFDEGIQNQLIWQLAHFRQFTTVRGVPFLGNHASFGFLLLAPFTWIGAGPNTWNVLNAVALAAGALVLYRIAQDKLGRPWLSFWVGVVWLMQPSVQWWVQEGFHPECVALPFLFATYLYGERILVRHRTGALVGRRLTAMFVLSFLGTIIWKEDLALALVGMGLIWVVRRDWRFGMKVVTVGALWFAVFGAWMVPHFAKGTVYGGIYGDLGNTPGQVVTTSLSHPSRLAQRLSDNDALRYSQQLNESFAYVSVLSPVTWLIGAPQWLVDISSTSDFTWDLKFHYQAIPLASLAISFIEGVALLHRRRRWLGEVAAIGGVVVAIYCAHVYGPAPGSINYRIGFWPLRASPSQSANEAVVRLVGPNDGVSADYLLVPHMTHRQVVYTFPNPWLNSNYGITPDAHGDPSKVRWVAIDTAMLSERDRRLYDSVRASGEFRVALANGSIVVLTRIRPPGAGTAPIESSG